MGLTGKSYDIKASLMDYSARWYSPSAGRFTTQDTWAGNPTSPQTLNRYAYAMNNPVNITDPSGHKPCYIDDNGNLRCGYSSDPGTWGSDNSNGGGSGGDNGGGDSGGGYGYGGNPLGSGGDSGNGGDPFGGGGGYGSGGDGGDSGGGTDPVPLTPQQILELRKQVFYTYAGNAPSVDQHPNGQYPNDAIYIVPTDKIALQILAIVLTGGAGEALVTVDTVGTASIESATVAGENGNLASDIYNGAADSRVSSNEVAVEDPTPSEPGVSNGSGTSEGTGQVTADNLEFSAKQTMQQWNKQMAQRGWNKQSVADVRNNPFTTRSAVNRTTGNSATAYYTKDGAYVVVDNATGKVVQISNAKNPAAWAPDSSISDPYEPWKK